MCGIVGYVGHSDRAQDVILDGLRRLEYRGYDSAGIAVLVDGKLRVIRAQGKLVNLEGVLREVPLAGSIGIGHTRWATHGKPSERNAHPHVAGSVAVIGNGIVENFRELRDELEANGCVFKSDTDTEVISHLVYEARKRGAALKEAVRGALGRLEGSCAIAVIDESSPGEILISKNGGNPIVVGHGKGENFVASDIATLLPYTRHIQILHDGEMARVTADSVSIETFDGTPVAREKKLVQWDPVQAEKGGYDRFMQKEIFEQPRAIGDTIGARVLEVDGDIDLDGIDLDTSWVRELAGVQLVACGTAWHASLIGRSMIERLARIPCSVDLASEYRYGEPIASNRHLVIPVSQSGETADTIAALKEGSERGAKSLAICNVHDSTIARTANWVLYTHAGPEIGVASTKCFTTQVVALYLLALKLGILRGSLARDDVRRHGKELRRLPRLVEQALGLWPHVESIARRHQHARDFLFLGKGYGFPIALEGALKLKEISYIHAEGYASGEMKHGPIALIDEKMPVVVIMPRDRHFEKTLSNLQEVRARDGQVIAITTEGD
ncbi:MAG TPA: glutamine--fructose-6-phosphate transaminase (isomerizing), partial [Myxococcota bacterium]|nr:glutamine--fructose-6-phosphate transaminase (isomerizing) [Myxococcota bacterium]